MNGANRTPLAVVAGFGVGLAVGPLSVFAINARDVLRSNEAWPASTQGYFLALLVTSVPTAVNGAIGAGVASRRGSLERRAVTILPAMLHAVVAVGALLREPQSFVGLQWYTLAFTAVVWSAGRVGQRIGRRLAGGGRGAMGTPSEVGLVGRRDGRQDSSADQSPEFDPSHRPEKS